MLNAEAIKRVALSFGADVVGIGPMTRFERAPADHDPRFIFPEAKSVIGMGFRIHRGTLRGPEEGVAFGMYGAEEYANTNNSYIPMTLRRLGNYIEDRGFDAVVYNQGHRQTWGPVGTPVRPGYPRPDVLMHLRIAGVICGLGEIGWSKIFLNPKLGPRLRLAFVFTDADLEPDPLVEPGTLCDRCLQCVRDCPSQSIPKPDGETESVTIEGKTYTWGKLKETRCFIGFQAPKGEKNPFLAKSMDPANIEVRRQIERADQLGDSPDDDAERMKIRSTIEANFRPSAQGNYNYHYTTAVCGASCIRTCMVHLEKRNKLTDTFNTPFRIRKPWRLAFDGDEQRPKVCQE